MSDNVHRGINFRFHVPTADALRSLMVSAGVSTVLEPEKVVSGATLGAQVSNSRASGPDSLMRAPR